MIPPEYEARVAPPGSTLRYSLMALPLTVRHGLIGLHALHHELHQLPLLSEPAVAAAKLDWWQEEWLRLDEGRPQHPLTQALAALANERGIDFAPLREWLGAVRMDLDYDLYPGFEQLVVYCHRSGSSLAMLKAEVLGHEDRETPAFAHELGVMLTLSRQLIEVRRNALAGRCYIPESELTRFAVGVEQLQGRATSPALQALFAFQLQRIRDYYRQALARLPERDRRGQCSQLMLAELILARLAEIEADGLRLLEQQVHLTPLMKFWLAWKILRREKRRARRRRH